MADNNLRQAMVPDGAEVIAQTRGTAPGLICPVDGGGGRHGQKVVYAVPGVPHEMRDMFERAVLPDLHRRAGADVAVIASRVLRTWGESESGLNERLDDVIARLDATGNPTLAFLASGWEGLKVRLTAKATTHGEAAAVLDRWEVEIRSILGPQVFGVDEQSMESVVLDLLRERGLTLGLAESVTGGLVAARLTEIAGASDVLRGSIVSYASDVKFDLLGVPAGPVVSEEAAAAMAAGAQRVLGRRRRAGPHGRRRPDRAGRHGGGHVVPGHRDRRCAGHDHHLAPSRHARPDAPVLRDLVARPASTRAARRLNNGAPPPSVALERPASVAQWRERPASTRLVGGSNPSGGAVRAPAQRLVKCGKWASCLYPGVALRRPFARHPRTTRGTGEVQEG